MFLKSIILSAISLLTVSVQAFDLSDSIRIDTLLLDDGSLYRGQIRDSLFNGKGTCVYPDGTMYEGEWKDGLWDGEGAVRYPDGDVYVGEFRKHVKEGRGTYFYHDGARYDGEWSNDMFNGTGRLVFADGGRYDGAWKDDRKHGFGKLTQGKDKATFTGYFYNDEFLGYPHDTYLTKEIPLTDELKSWGFQTDPTDLFEDVRTLSFMTSYGSNGVLGISMWLDFSDLVFGGFSFGFNINAPTWGPRCELAAWNSDDVHIEGRYPNRTLMADIGFKWKNLSLGGSAGLGTTIKYQNCRVNSNKYEVANLKIGDVFYRTRDADDIFAWRVFTRYTFTKNAIPLAFFSLGYGNCDGLFAGIGIYMRF